jgi:hypothetical protein
VVRTGGCYLSVSRGGFRIRKILPVKTLVLSPTLARSQQEDLDIRISWLTSSCAVQRIVWRGRLKGAERRDIHRAATSGRSSAFGNFAKGRCYTLPLTRSSMALPRLQRRQVLVLIEESVHQAVYDIYVL